MKRIILSFIAILTIGASVFFGCASKEDTASIRKQYPIIDAPANMSTRYIPLDEFIKYPADTVKYTVKKTAPQSTVEIAGQEVTYNIYQVEVKSVVIDKTGSLHEGDVLSFRSNKIFDTSYMKEGTTIISTITYDENSGCYDFSSHGAYYCIDGKVWSIYEEREPYILSGISEDDFINRIREIK